MVEALGPDVKNLKVGDHVVLTYGACGHCAPCVSGHETYCKNFYAHNFGGTGPDGDIALQSPDGKPLHDHFFTQSSFSTYALSRERNAIKVPAEAPLALLGPLGCGIQTGAGAVINSLKVRPGSSFVAYGAGAVGLSAGMAARVAGATTIIAVDVVPSRLELADELGATHTINSREVDCEPAPECDPQPTFPKGTDLSSNSRTLPGSRSAPVATPAESRKMKTHQGVGMRMPWGQAWARRITPHAIAGTVDSLTDDPPPVSEWLPAFARWVNAPEPPRVSVEEALKRRARKRSTTTRS